jgi:predicted DNA-binding transcriptional regulator YafY
MLGLRWVARRGDRDLSRAANDTVAKIGAILPERLKPFLFDAGLVLPSFTKLAEDRIDVARFRSAIRESRKVEIAYRSEDGRETTRVIWPIAIAYFDAQRLVAAWCELRSDFRTFRTDRMLALRLTGDKYPERRKALLKKWQEQVARETGRNQLDVFT